MTEQTIYDRILAKVVSADAKSLLAAVEKALSEGAEPVDIIDKGLTPGMREVGEKFRRYEIYLPEMMMASDAWEQAMNVLYPRMASVEGERRSVGRVVIGTVKGDVHSLGKGIVAAMLRAAGFDVLDLGIDVPPSVFVTKAAEVGADVIAVSALMTTTMPQQRSVIEHLQAQGVRDKYYVLIGGGSTTQEWAGQIGADGYGATAGDGVNLALAAVAARRNGWL